MRPSYALFAVRIVGTWCSGITSASHAEGPGLKSQCVQTSKCLFLRCIVWRRELQELHPQEDSDQYWPHGVVVSHPLCMRKALGSNPSVSTFASDAWSTLCLASQREQSLETACLVHWRRRRLSGRLKASFGITSVSAWWVGQIIHLPENDIHANE